MSSLKVEDRRKIKKYKKTLEDLGIDLKIPQMSLFFYFASEKAKEIHKSTDKKLNLASEDIIFFS